MSVGVRCRKTVDYATLLLQKLVIRIVVILENVGMFRLMVCNFVVLGENTCETSAQSIDELKDGLSSDLLVKQGKFSVALSVILGFSRTNRPFSIVQYSRAKIYTALHFNHTVSVECTLQCRDVPFPATLQYRAVQYSAVNFHTFIQYSARASSVHFNTALQCSAVHFHATIQYITVQRCALPCYITVQCSAVQCS